MIKKIMCGLSAVVIGAVSVLTGCGSSKEAESNALTWCTWKDHSIFEPFIELLHEKNPEVELEFTSYTGGNATGYSWAQMRADDIPDVFITSQIVDEELAKERLVDLSGYDFISEFSTALLDQVSIDGGIYMLPISHCMYGITYNKTLMEEHGWELPQNFSELESLCSEIKKAGLIPGIITMNLTGSPFSAVFNLAKTDWFTTTDGIKWEQDFLAGNATAQGMWEGTMDYVQKYIDIGMYTPDPEDRNNKALVEDYLAGRKAVFLTTSSPLSDTTLSNGDEVGIMPYISKDGSSNIYMYSADQYFGISRRLTEPGNEKKLENAIKLLSLLYSEEGQATFDEVRTPTAMSTRDNTEVPEDSVIYDAQQAMREGRAFPMTYVHWENILADIGQSYKDWIRGENNMDGEKCIARMDELQTTALSNIDTTYFCESTADFTLEQTAELVGKAIGSAVGADAAMIPLSEFHDGVELKMGVSGKLYKEPINYEIATIIIPSNESVNGYTLMTMTGAEANALAKEGFDYEGNGNPFPYVLAAKGGKLDDDKTYKVVFPIDGYTEQTASKYNAVVVEESGSLRDFVHEWLEEQKVVSPDGNPWE